MLGLSDIRKAVDEMTKLSLVVMLDGNRLEIEAPDGDDAISVASGVHLDTDIKTFSNRYLEPMIWKLEQLVN